MSRGGPPVARGVRDPDYCDQEGPASVAVVMRSTSPERQGAGAAQLPLHGHTVAVGTPQKSEGHTVVRREPGRSDPDLSVTRSRTLSREGRSQRVQELARYRSIHCASRQQ